MTLKNTENPENPWDVTIYEKAYRALKKEGHSDMDIYHLVKKHAPKENDLKEIHFAPFLENMLKNLDVRNDDGAWKWRGSVYTGNKGSQGLEEVRKGVCRYNNNKVIFWGDED